MALIYKIINHVNNKIYIGKTSNSMERRFKEHISESKKSRSQKRPLYDAFNKYGIENFSIELVEDNLTDEEACEREKFWIANYKSYIGFDDCNGYNATLGGDSKHTYDYKAICQKYLELQTISKTAEYFHCDVATVRKALKNENISVIKRTKRTNRKQVQCVETGVIYDSVSLAGTAYNLNAPESGYRNISRALSNNTTAYGKHWIYI